MAELDESKITTAGYSVITANSPFGEVTCFLNKIRLLDEKVQLVYGCLDNEGHDRFFYFDMPLNAERIIKSIESEE